MKAIPGDTRDTNGYVEVYAEGRWMTEEEFEVHWQRLEEADRLEKEYEEYLERDFHKYPYSCGTHTYYPPKKIAG